MYQSRVGEDNFHLAIKIKFQFHMYSRVICTCCA